MMAKRNWIPRRGSKKSTMVILWRCCDAKSLLGGKRACDESLGSIGEMSRESSRKSDAELVLDLNWAVSKVR